jgi:hypothetical protein
VNGAAYCFIVLASVVIGGIQADGFVVALLPLESFLLGEGWAGAGAHEEQEAIRFVCPRLSR